MLSDQTGACILGCAGLTLTIDEKSLFTQSQPLGFILFGRNIATAPQVQALCAELRASVGWHAPILIDQEGGRVQRLLPPLGRIFLPPFEHCKRAGQQAAKAMYLRFRIIAAELQALGLDVNCAPVADIAQPETHPFLRNRCYGDTLDRVVPLARAAANGLLAGGVLPVLKHMPGHGRAQVDSHLDLPNVAASAATLQAHDFAAFAGLKDVPMAMTAHVVYDAFDLQPATISAPMLKIMRQEIGFLGLIMTDDISMQALPADVATRAALAIFVGCDVVLHCNGQIDEMRAVVAASGRLTAAARRRAELALAQRHAGDMVDISALEAQILRLTTGRAHD